MTLTKPNLIIAGASGLIGGQAIRLIKEHDLPLGTTYSLCRRPAMPDSDKIMELVSPDLTIDTDTVTEATLGLICLGTTKKQAGSNAGLYQVDHDLVVRVAKEMKSVGVTRIAVVSSYGANQNSPSHYLRCKGEMERDVCAIGFERVIFARPGPLQGTRHQPRSDEVLLQKFMPLVLPLMRGPLLKLRPIQGAKVAEYLLHTLLSEPADTAHSGTLVAYYPQMIDVNLMPAERPQ